MKRTLPLRGSRQEIRASSYVHLGMLLTRVQHTWHIYCHGSSHQDHGLDHSPLYIRVFHLAHRPESHCTHPKEEGKEMTHRGLQYHAQPMLVPEKELCGSVSLAFKYRTVQFLICLFEKSARTQVDHCPCSQPVRNVLGAKGKEDLKTESTESLGGGLAASGTKP